MLTAQMNTEDDIRLLPQAHQHQVCEDVTCFDDQLTKTAQHMTRVLRRTQGMGLAAPQLGVLLRLIVVDIPSTQGDNRSLIIANPHLLQSRGSEKGSETCLSLPGQTYIVNRATHIVVEGQGLTGATVRCAASGTVARCIQHGIDHLDGVTIDMVGVPA